MRAHLLLIGPILLLLLSVPVRAQLFTGTEGLISVPSAEMLRAGDFQIGTYFMNRHFTPDVGFTYDGIKYNTVDFFVSITPFSWIEVSYTFTLLKTLTEGHEKPSLNNKDRYFSLRLNPLREGYWWPSVVVGTNDPFRTSALRGTGKSYGFFCNYYLAATKHFMPHNQELGINLAYRYYPDAKSRRWQGLVGGITWRPSWVPNLRAIAEYNGEGVDVGADVLLWKHLFLQAALQNCKWFIGGLSYRANLF